MPSRRRFAVRALIALALVLCVPFIALALVATVVVVWIVTGDRGIGTLLGLAALVCGMPGLASLRAFGRAPRRVDAGVRIDSDSEPVLSELVAEEFRALHLAPPQHLEVTLQPETKVVRDGKIRTLVLGAPLVFGARERAVRVAVAHAALIDRSALGRLLRGRAWRVLETAHLFSFTPVAGRPWRILVEAIWRAVAAALRRDVLLADAACARRFGRDAAATHTRALVRHDAFAAYWAQDVAPCLDAGFHPPILEGWRRFERNAAVADQINAQVAAELGTVTARGDPWPAIGERLAAIDRCAISEDAPESAIVESQAPLAQIEAAVLRTTDAGRGGALVELDWARAGDAVWLPRLRMAVAPHRDALARRTIGDLHELARSSPEIAGTDPDRAPSLDVLAAALAVALAREGWALVVDPGEELRAVRDDVAVFVLSVPAALAHDDGDEWQRLLDDEQLANVALVDPEATLTPASESAAEHWPTLTVPATLDLPRTDALRRNTRLVLGAAWILGVPICAGMFYAAIAAPTVLGRVLFGVLAPVCSIAVAWWMRSRIRVARSSGALHVTPLQLRIEDAALLRAPFVIDRAQVDTIAIDDGAVSSGLDAVRFPYGSSQWLHPSGDPALAASGWLWTGPHLNSVPMLGAGDETPNLLLLFCEDVPSPQLRRRGDGLPEKDAPLTGLALATADPVAARDALAGWGVVRPLTHADAMRLASPAPALMRDRSAIRRNERRGWLLVLAGLIVPVVALFALSSVIQMWPFERLRAQLLAFAAVAVFVARLGLYVGWF